MQLNKTNGNIIEIVSFNKDTGRCVYDEFEGITKFQNTTPKKFYKIKNRKEQYQVEKMLRDIDYSINDNNLTIDENILKLAYLKLIEILNDGWVLSDDTQNWIFADKPFRLFVNTFETNREFMENTEYRALVNGIALKHADTMLFDKVNTMMYVDALIAEERAIIEDFVDDWIFIESK